MGGRRYSAREREELLDCLANWQDSIAGFAKVHGVSVGTLYNWKQQIADKSPEADLGFVEIGQPLSPELGVHLTLNIGSVSLHFEQLPDTDWLAALIEKLSR